MTPKTKLPKHPLTLNVGHKTYSIIQKSLSKDNLYGCVEFTKNSITIDPNQSLEDYKSTLLHEITHVGFDLFGLGDDDEMPNQMGNEFLTSVTSNMFILLAALNPELFSFILSNE
tara:strand:- start:258 stop:602 length:345 start_codon:yes stop_codon:yes gene_type:complete